MKKRVLTKENTDKIGVNLLKAARITDAEIENIVNKPQLFYSVAAKIKAEETNRRTNIQERISPIFGFRVFGATAIAIVLVIAAIFFYNRPNNSPEMQIAQNESIVKPPTAEFSGEKPISPLPSVETKQIVKTFARATKNVQKTLNPNRQSKSTKTPNVSISLPVLNKLPAEKADADEGKFYALPFADNSTDDNITQIVRAELSRAELSALGIEFPLSENEDEKFLTDLVYGANGNPKAFRLIGKL